MSVLEKSWVREPKRSCWKCLLITSILLERARRYWGCMSATLREYSSIYLYYINTNNSAAWSRPKSSASWPGTASTPPSSLLGRPPYIIDRSSIFPLIITTLIIEVPTAAIAYAIITRPFYPYPLVPILMLLNLFTIFMLCRCVYTDPGIIGQIVDKYEWE